LFLRPAIEVLQGMTVSPNRAVLVELGECLGANDQRQDYIRAQLHTREDGRQVVSPFARQDSAMMSRLAQCDALIVRKPHAEPAHAGDMVTVLELPVTPYGY